jgi:hypothetical protein
VRLPSLYVQEIESELEGDASIRSYLVEKGKTIDGIGIYISGSQSRKSLPGGNNRPSTPGLKRRAYSWIKDKLTHSPDSDTEDAVDNLEQLVASPTIIPDITEQVIVQHVENALDQQMKAIEHENQENFREFVASLNTEEKKPAEHDTSESDDSENVDPAPEQIVITPVTDEPPVMPSPPPLVKKLSGMELRQRSVTTFKKVQIPPIVLASPRGGERERSPLSARGKIIRRQKNEPKEAELLKLSPKLSPHLPQSPKLSPKASQDANLKDDQEMTEIDQMPDRIDPNYLFKKLNRKTFITGRKNSLAAFSRNLRQSIRMGPELTNNQAHELLHKLSLVRFNDTGDVVDIINQEQVKPEINQKQVEAQQLIANTIQIWHNLNKFRFYVNSEPKLKTMRTRLATMKELHSTELTYVFNLKVFLIFIIH